MNKHADVSVITVSHNHGKFLKRYFDSLMKNRDGLSVEIFLVDNGSTDTTAEIAAAYTPGITLISRPGHFGFAANNNLAVGRSTGRYVMLLNPDTETPPGTLRRLVDFMDAHPDVGICGPQLRFPDGSLQYSCRKFPNWKSVIARRTPFLRTLLRKSTANAEHLMMATDHTKIQDVDWMLGAGLFIRRETLADIGLLDQRYFLYGEDIDLCLRAKRAGWRISYVPQAKIIHYHMAVSDKSFLTVHTYHHLWSMAYYYLKNIVPEKLGWPARPHTPGVRASRPEKSRQRAVKPVGNDVG
jgi:N-acetylglucosaminyl-diphospho-decaprenol L-rhamnosyltransferase